MFFINIHIPMLQSDMQCDLFVSDLFSGTSLVQDLWDRKI